MNGAARVPADGLHASRATAACALPPPPKPPAGLSGLGLAPCPGLVWISQFFTSHFCPSASQAVSEAALEASQAEGLDSQDAEEGLSASQKSKVGKVGWGAGSGG